MMFLNCLVLRTISINEPAHLVSLSLALYAYIALRTSPSGFACEFNPRINL